MKLGKVQPAEKPTRCCVMSSAETETEAVECYLDTVERPRGRAAYWDRQFRRARDLIGKIVLYDPRGRDVGEAPSNPIIGEVVGNTMYEPEFSQKYGPLVTIGYGERCQRSKGAPYFYTHRAKVPVAACREVTLNATVCGPVS